MNKEFNPDVVTYNERPSQEAIKATTYINRYLYWMSNQSSQERFRNAFGKVLGDHFWNKLMHNRTNYGTFGGDVYLWFEMTNNNRDILMHYIIKSGYRTHEQR